MPRLGDVLVIGLGVSGDAAARYCADRLGDGCDSVTVIDKSVAPKVMQRAEGLEALGVRVLLGSESIPGAYDLGIMSPGIPPSSALMRGAREACDRVVSEIEFAYERSGSAWVAITGTNGKTTTTLLVAHLLNSAGVAARAVGNVGVPAISAVAQGDSGEILVAEVSSFQLALVEGFHPRVAVLLNVTPDHINWHGSFERYLQDKTRIFQNLTPDDTAVVDVDDAVAAPWADRIAETGASVVRVSLEPEERSGATVVDGVMTLVRGSSSTPLARVDDLLIKGPHNVSNALAAAAAVHALGVSARDITEGLLTFRPIEHRLEPCGSACGADWFNDSKATNPDAVFKALAAFGDQGLVLLLGGRSKGSDFTPLAVAAAERAHDVVVFGEAGEEIGSAFVGLDVAIHRARDLSGATEVACGVAREGDAVVLSPACASFDEFENYEQRGRAFKRLVSELGKRTNS